MLEFASVVNAVECAIEMQRSLHDRNASLPESQRMAFRMGINIGDVIVDGEDVQGHGVNVAARLQALADPGGILLSGDAYRYVEKKLDVRCEDLGERELKNISRPVQVYRLNAITDTEPAADAMSLPLPSKP